MQDLSSYFVIYNFIIGVLLMLSSDNLGRFAAVPFGKIPSRAIRVQRIANIAVMAFGATVAAFCGFIYLLFHLLRIGV